MSADAKSLLLEIGCEEVPARMLPGAAADFAGLVAAILDRAGLAHGAPRLFWTPRRFAALFPETAGTTPRREETLTGPPAAAAWDKEGKPTKALLGFAGKQGLDPASFERLETPRGVYAAARVARGGETVGAVLAASLPAAVGAMAFPKTMRWGLGEHRFVRPIHWIVALHGEEALPIEIMGIAAGRATFGHRTLGPGAHDVASADAWEAVLEKAGVVADPAKRRARFGAALAETAATRGGRPVDDPELLEEVADISEYPGALSGTFDERFVRDVPAEVLETCLRHHQKAFLVVGESGPRPAFAVGVNVPSDPEGHVQRGHEWVVSGRLADAVYFWASDRKERLELRAPRLEGVVYQKELGTYGAKSRRVARLAAELAERAGLDAAARRSAERAGLLARCDLVSGLVGEFPELQGVAGGLLARADGEPEPVAAAIYDLYRPSGADDRLPGTDIGAVVGLADRLDTLAGGFAVGLIPSGSRDPFALRRAGLGVVRLAERFPALDLAAALDAAFALFDGEGGSPDLRGKAAEARPKVIDFLLERFAALAKDAGARYDEVAAVRAVAAAKKALVVADLTARLAALREFRGSDDFLALAAASKRVGNILAQAAERGEAQAPGAGADALALPAETALSGAADEAERRVAELRDKGDYRSALAALAALRPVVDRFFVDVLVMDPDDRARRARLGLLARVDRLARAVVDISEIVVEGAEKA